MGKTHWHWLTYFGLFWDSTARGPKFDAGVIAIHVIVWAIQRLERLHHKIAVKKGNPPKQESFIIQNHSHSGYLFIHSSHRYAYSHTHTHIYIAFKNRVINQPSYFGGPTLASVKVKSEGILRHLWFKFRFGDSTPNFSWPKASVLGSTPNFPQSWCVEVMIRGIVTQVRRRRVVYHVRMSFKGMVFGRNRVSDVSGCCRCQVLPQPWWHMVALSMVLPREMMGSIWFNQ